MRIDTLSQDDIRTITRVAEKAEAESHICEKAVKDILDEIGDCMHDDMRLRRRMIIGVFLRPDMKRKIAVKFISAMSQRRCPDRV